MNRARSTERSPHLEAFKARGYEVLFFVDPIDEFVAQSIPEFEGKPLVSVARAGVELGSEAERKEAEDARKARDTELRPFLAFLEQTLARHDPRGARVVAPDHLPGVPRRGRARPEPGHGAHAAPGLGQGRGDRPRNGSSR